MAPILNNGIITLFRQPNPGHLSSGMGQLDHLPRNATPEQIANALVQRCESALKVMQAAMPEAYSGKGETGDRWVMRRCEAHVWTSRVSGRKAFGRDEAVLQFAGIMMGICLYGIWLALFGPTHPDDEDQVEDANKEGQIALRESASDNAPRPVNHADLNRAVIDEKAPLPDYTPASQTDYLPAYTDDPNGTPVPLKREEVKQDERAVVGPYDALFLSSFGGPMY